MLGASSCCGQQSLGQQQAASCAHMLLPLLLLTGMARQWLQVLELHAAVVVQYQQMVLVLH